MQLWLSILTTLSMFLFLLIVLAIVSVTSVGTGLPTHRLPSVTALQGVSHLLPGLSTLHCQVFLQRSFSMGFLVTRFRSFIASICTSTLLWGHHIPGKETLQTRYFLFTRKGFALLPTQTEQGAEPPSCFSNLTFLLGCPSGFYLCLWCKAV